jgi:transcriptional regulator of acetoin/glycerol metabolism
VAERAAAQENAALNQLIADLEADGARMTDIADVLNISRTTAYARLKRARP